MHKVWIVVERKLLTEDTEVRLYLSLVRESRWPAIQQASKAVIRMLCRLLVSAIATLPFGLWIVHFAYLERGYKAYGGEYLIIALLCYIIFKALGGVR